MGKRRRAREMAMQMLYQHELGGSSLAQIFSSFDLEGYLRETEAAPEAAAAGTETPADPESKKRAEKSFRYARRLVQGTMDHCTAIDELIRRHAENWRLERMPTIDRNILRLAIYEMLHETSVPKVVIVDEAIELAKRFGSENSGRFVNGLLDGVLRASRSGSVAAAAERKAGKPPSPVAGGSS